MCGKAGFPDAVFCNMIRKKVGFMVLGPGEFMSIAGPSCLSIPWSRVLWGEVQTLYTEESAHFHNIVNTQEPVKAFTHEGVNPFMKTEGLSSNCTVEQLPTWDLDQHPEAMAEGSSSQPPVPPCSHILSISLQSRAAEMEGCSRRLALS